MEKLVFSTWIVIVLTVWSTTPVHSENYSKSVPYKTVQLTKTNLHFYLHDIVSGPNATAIPIAGSNTTMFGRLLAIDDPITEGPEITSKNIGNARGMYVLASKDDKDLTLVLYMDIGFTSGEFKGSSLSVLSRNPILESPREVAVVGGRGRFRSATGFITVNTHSVDGANAVLEYSVEVVHT